MGLSGGCRAVVGSMSWPARWPVPTVESMNGTRIVDLRTQRGWTQERLAEASGITVRTVQRLEAGNDASLDTLTRVATALDVQVGDLTTAPTRASTDATCRPSTPAPHGSRNAATRSPTDSKPSTTASARCSRSACSCGIKTDAFANHAIYLIPAYWIAGWLLSLFRFLVVLSPRMDRRFPLSRDRREPTPDGRT